jgi:hypothetical protein
MPSFQICVAPIAASFFPSVVSGTSAQPVKRLASFHADWPCLRKTIVACASFELATMRLLEAAALRRASGRERALPRTLATRLAASASQRASSASPQSDVNARIVETRSFPVACGGFRQACARRV